MVCAARPPPPLDPPRRLLLLHHHIGSCAPSHRPAALPGGRYVFEDDATLKLSAEGEDVQCVLARLERLASPLPSVPLLYLGYSDPTYPSDANASGPRQVYVGKKKAREAARGAHLASPCAALCTFAYAVRASAAPTLWARSRAVVP